MTPTATPHHVPIRVLLVDDNHLFRDGVAHLLSKDRRFAVVGRCSRGAEAVAAAGSLHPDLILIDLKMPEMDGVEAIRRIRATDQKVAIGLLTGFEGPLIQSALHAGANSYVAKDSTPDELCDAAVRMVREPRRALAPIARTTPSSSPDGLLGRLTRRELEVLRLLGQGKSNPVIARRLGISPKTLRNHISNIYRKLKVFDRAQAVLLAVREGLISVGR